LHHLNFFLHLHEKYYFDRVKQVQQAILNERNTKYRANRPLPEVKDKTVLLVDDGIATGATMRAAIAVLRQLNCAYLVVAVPVAPRSSYHEFQKIVDELVCLETPEPFFAIGNWYQNFSQTTDDEVTDLLARAQENIKSKE